MTKREKFFKNLLNNYLFYEEDRDGWRCYGERKYKQFGGSGDTTTSYRMQTGFCSHINIEQNEYSIIETGADPVCKCEERAYCYHSYEEMFDSWSQNFKEIYKEKLEEYRTLEKYDKVPSGWLEDDGEETFYVAL